ncbi:hypothetical protein [Paraburkholderia terrae]|uniref:Uncharacterized protein n=1 Tax=Paraburkholderia terrae TaxID=311230 RepID=A0ABM7TMQ9_9BURK|nr:hypothetical protein [Paraburkholderia terrae]BCZ80304.1 hypothetical protein PTKU64_39790 [Paraburkholderia terrae]BDC41231.1 hypothetical protein PTKU15_45280 [Paraburkholderia terrae]
MINSTAQAGLSLSRPVFTDREIQFSAFGLNWGFCSYAIPVDLAVERLGASDSSGQQLNLAFQINRQRIMQAVIEAGSPVPGKRVLLVSV